MKIDRRAFVTLSAVLPALATLPGTAAEPTPVDPPRWSEVHSEH